MAKKFDNEPIAGRNLCQQALNNAMGPIQSTTDASLTGQNAQNALAALQKSQQQSAVPNPTTSTSGGAMAQNANGVNAGGGNVMTKQQVPSSDNLLGVRAELNNAGINNVGWNAETGRVTIGGKDYIKPTNVTDGTSYADRQTIQKAINSYYSDTGKPLEGADAYVGNALGVKGAVTWSDGNLMVGGQIVPTVYVDDNGTAYAHKSDLDNAIETYKKSAGITGNQDIYNNWQDTYGRDIQKALKAVTNRKEWSYDTDNDPAYQAYKEQYIRKGNRAYQDAYAQMAANTGGYGSSTAMSAAGQQMNYYMQQLNDRVPELMQNDYSRYLGEQQLRQQALDSIMGVANDDYSKQYQANRDAVSDANESNYQSWLRRKDARDYNRDVLESDRTWPYQEALLRDQTTQSGIDTSRYAENADLDIATKQLANEGARLANWQTQVQNILTKYNYGNPDTPISAEDAEALGAGPKADGTYPTIRDMQTWAAEMEAIGEWIPWDKAQRQITQETWNINNALKL